MNNFKAFFKEKGLYLLCLALVLIATVTGVLAVNRVVRSVADLTATRQKALEENSVWNQPDTIVNNPAEEVPIATPAPTPAPPAASQAPSEPASASSQPSGGSSAAGASGGSAASQAPSSTWPVDAEAAVPFSGEELVYNETLGDWRTHNGADYTCQLGSGVQAAVGGTVAAVTRDALWGTVVEVTGADGVTWRYCGLEEAAVAAGDAVERGTILGVLGEIPSETHAGPHLHLECVQEDAYLDPESCKP